MRRLLIASLALCLSAPAMAQNQFPDPNLLAPADMQFFGAPDARYELPSIVFTCPAVA